MGKNVNMADNPKKHMMVMVCVDILTVKVHLNIKFKERKKVERGDDRARNNVEKNDGKKTQ